jgi:hypothetical protein
MDFMCPNLSFFNASDLNVEISLTMTIQKQDPNWHRLKLERIAADTINVVRADFENAPSASSGRGRFG